MARFVVVILVCLGALLLGVALLNPYWAKKRLHQNRKLKLALSKWLNLKEPKPVTEAGVTSLLVYWWSLLGGAVGAFCSVIVVRGIQPFRILLIAAVCAAFFGWVTYNLRAGWVEKRRDMKA